MNIGRETSEPSRRLETSLVFSETSEPRQRPGTNLTFPEASEPISSSEVFLQKLSKSRLLLFAIFILAAGCSRETPISGSSPFYAGTFEASCSPVDAPAVVFDLYRLGDPEPPMVSIAVWQFESPVEGSQIQLRSQGGYGAAFIGGTEWIPASDGVIGLEEYQEGDAARGWFWLELGGFDRVEGQFEATWNDSGLAICG